MSDQAVPVGVAAAPVSEPAVLAEFAALRDEILMLSGHSEALYNFHIASAGVVMSYALAFPTRRPVAIVLALTTYLLYGRIQNTATATLRIGQYLRTVLAAKLPPGSMEWESWAVEHVRKPGAVVRLRFHEEITYLGVPLMGLALSGASLVTVNAPSATWGITVVGWFVGLGFAGLTLRIILAARKIRRDALS